MPKSNPTEAPELHVSPVVPDAVEVTTSKGLFVSQFSVGVSVVRVYVALGRVS
jgi:hypothetical protein